MSRPPRLLLALAIGLAATLSAPAQVTPFFAPMVPYPQTVNTGPPPAGSALLLEASAGNLLLEGGTDNLCLEGSTSC